MEKCFVIQPFDNGKFDNRFEDTYQPAINECDLVAYRVDRDPNSNILINDIEKNIKESKIVLAEISDDNPNVWYELGYAFACGKDVVMICDNNRNKFPFDIQHRHILKYSTDSKSDFENLQKRIVEKIKVIIEKQNQIRNIMPTLIEDTTGLTAHEKHAIVIIMSEQFSDEDTMSQNSIINQMSSIGYTEIATNIALRKLQNKGLVDVKRETEDGTYGYYEFNTYKLTENGIRWVFENEDKIVLTKNIATEKTDEVPF